MKTISLNGKDYQFPENWTEVDPKHLTDLLRLLFVLPENGSTYLEILRIVMGYAPKQWTKLMRHYFQDPEKIDHNTMILSDLVRLISWMWTAELTVRPMEGFQVDGQKWLLFDEGFKSMTFGEMTNAYIHCQAWIKQLIEGNSRLDLLVATIARPAREDDYEKDPEWNGDVREPYNSHMAERRAALLEGRYFEEKILSAMYFLGTVKEFFSFFDLFDSDGPPEAEDYPGQSMVKNQHLLAEKHIFGGMQLTKEANVHDVFQFLEEHRKDIKEQNRRAETSRHEANSN